MIFVQTKNRNKLITMKNISAFTYNHGNGFLFIIIIFIFVFRKKKY